MSVADLLYIITSAELAWWNQMWWIIYWSRDPLSLPVEPNRIHWNTGVCGCNIADLTVVCCFVLKCHFTARWRQWWPSHPFTTSPCPMYGRDPQSTPLCFFLSVSYPASLQGHCCTSISGLYCTTLVGSQSNSICSAYCQSFSSCTCNACPFSFPLQFAFVVQVSRDQQCRYRDGKHLLLTLKMWSV